WSAVRSDEEAPSPGEKRLEVHRAKLALTIFLPLGSEPGKYEIEILRRKGTPLLGLGGIARIENGNTVLSTRADLNKLASGNYLIAIRQPPWDWRYYPFTLR
ncbi:MAG: hypothetical protein ACRD2B_18470, partial [Terriglobia bacterium]